MIKINYNILSLVVHMEINVCNLKEINLNHVLTCRCIICSHALFFSHQLLGDRNYIIGICQQKVSLGTCMIKKLMKYVIFPFKKSGFVYGYVYAK